MDIVRILKISGVIAGLCFTLIGCKEQMPDTNTKTSEAQPEDMGFLIASDDANCPIAKIASVKADIPSARVYPEKLCFTSAGGTSGCIAAGNLNMNVYNFHSSLVDLIKAHASEFPSGDFDGIEIQFSAAKATLREGEVTGIYIKDKTIKLGFQFTSQAGSSVEVPAFCLAGSLSLNGQQVSLKDPVL